MIIHLSPAKAGGTGSAMPMALEVTFFCKCQRHVRYCNMGIYSLATYRAYHPYHYYHTASISQQSTNCRRNVVPVTMDLRPDFKRFCTWVWLK